MRHRRHTSLRGFGIGPAGRIGPLADQSPSAVAVDGATITLTLGAPIVAGDDATVRYVAAAASNSLKDTDGNAVEDFSATLTTAQRD